MTHTARVACINGLPGAGKSTVARGVASRCERGVWLEGDHLQHVFTVSGCVDPGAGTDESVRQLHLRWDNLAALTRNFTAEGFTVMVDSLLIPSLWERFTTAIAPVRPAYLHLDPAPGVRHARDLARGHKTIGDTYDYIAAEFAPLRGLGTWIDSSEQSAEETIEQAWQALQKTWSE